jgi:hypothetical protein
MNKLAVALLLLAACVAAQASAFGSRASSRDELRLPTPSRKLLQSGQNTVAIATAIAKAIASGDSTAAAAAIAQASSQGPAGVAAVAQAVAVSIAAGTSVLLLLPMRSFGLLCSSSWQNLWQKSTTTWCSEPPYACMRRV